MTWLPADFVPPERVDLSTGRHHLRPIRATDVDLDMVAVTGSQPRLWSMYGEAWGWPPPTMTREQDREDLARHEAEIAAHEAFNYAVFDHDETAARLRLHRPAGEGRRRRGGVVDRLVGSDVERALDELVPRWLAEDWPLDRPRYVPRDISWAEWQELPSVPTGEASG